MRVEVKTSISNLCLHQLKYSPTFNAYEVSCRIRVESSPYQSLPLGRTIGFTPQNSGPPLLFFKEFSAFMGNAIQVYRIILVLSMWKNHANGTYAQAGSSASGSPLWAKARALEPPQRSL